MASIREIMAAGTPAQLARMLGSNQLQIVNAGGVDQASATPLTVNFALIETPANNNGVRLGYASGAAVTVLLNTGPQPCLVWPAEDDALNGQAPNQPLALAAGSVFLGVPSIDEWLAVVAPPGGGVPEAPLDGQLYGRQSAGWVALASALATTFLPLAGGTMAGPIVLSGPPTAAPQAATKAYVDAAPPGEAPVDGQIYGRQSAAWVQLASQFLGLAGGTLTGPLVLPGPPTAANQAATKAYVDETSSGVLIDWFGTGTADDTAIWTTALAWAASLGIPRIYAARPSNVKNLAIAQPIEIYGLEGFSFNLAATGGVGDSVLLLQHNYITLSNVTINMPRVNWRTSQAQPAGNYGVLVQSNPVGTVLSHIILGGVTVNGGNCGISFVGGDRITMRDCEVNGQFNNGVMLGGTTAGGNVVQAMTKVRINGLRMVSTGASGLILTAFTAGATSPASHQDIEIVNAYALCCGKLPGTYPGIYLSANSLRQFRLDGSAVKCGAGLWVIGSSCPVAAIPNLIADGWITMRAVLDTLAGGIDGVLIGCQDVAGTAGMVRRIHLSADVNHKGGATWTTGAFYDVGDGVSNAGNFYLCLGDANGLPGIAGASGPPTGTGTWAAAFYDGTLYWQYLHADPGLPTLLARGLNIQTLGTTTDGVTVDARIHNCGYGVMLVPRQNTADTAIRNLHLRSPVITGAAYGIVDTGNSSGTTTGTIQLKISNPVIEASPSGDSSSAALGIQLGVNGNGSTTGSTNVTAEIVGGRVGTTGAVPSQGSALRCNGGTVALTLSGDTHFMTDGPVVAYLQNGAYTVTAFDVTFQSTAAAGSRVLNVATVTGSWTNYGNVKIIQPDATQYGYIATGMTFSGSVIRGITTAAPTTPGSVGEVFKLSPETATIGRYVCTTAGSAGSAVWTAKI
jgi:hypothetical protein